MHVVGILGFHPERFRRISPHLSTLNGRRIHDTNRFCVQDLVGLFLRALFALGGDSPISHSLWAIMTLAAAEGGSGLTFLAAVVGEVRIAAD